MGQPIKKRRAHHAIGFAKQNAPFGHQKGVECGDERIEKSGFINEVRAQQGGIALILRWRTPVEARHPGRDAGDLQPIELRKFERVRLVIRGGDARALETGYRRNQAQATAEFEHGFARREHLIREQYVCQNTRGIPQGGPIGQSLVSHVKAIGIRTDQFAEQGFGIFNASDGYVAPAEIVSFFAELIPRGEFASEGVNFFLNAQSNHMRTGTGDGRTDY